MTTIQWRIDRSLSVSALSHFLEHQARRFRIAVRPTVIHGVVAPVLFLVAIGFGLGTQIDDPTALGTDDRTVRG